MTDVDVILPVYNEKESIEDVLEEWTIVFEKLHVTFSFIICEDGSTDGTKELLLKLQKIYPLTLNQKRHRRGYGQAVIDGISQSTADHILCVDADGQCDPNDFSKFWLHRYPRGVLIGLRTHRADKWYRKFYSKTFKLLFSILFPADIHDPSAPFVLFKKSILIPHIRYLAYLKEGFWWGFIGTCIKKGIPLKEIPINHRENKKRSTQVYVFTKIPSIALNNCVGLLRLRYAR